MALEINCFNFSDFELFKKIMNDLKLEYKIKDLEKGKKRFIISSGGPNTEFETGVIAKEIIKRLNESKQKKST